VASVHSVGRERPEAPCELRTCFARDRDRILHCNSFRRLKHKTQVFLSPEGDHYRTRLTHTLEVAQIARTIARALRLNEDLTEAIAMGHDLGHPPFGHAGERTLNLLCEGGFAHNEHSLRVVDKLEKDGQGLNLTAEVRDGILCHCGGMTPKTLEGKVVHLADRIAYTNHDIDDAIRAGVLEASDIPRPIAAILGDTFSSRINTLVYDIVDNSMETPEIIMTPRVSEAMEALRQFLFDTVYTNPTVKGEEGKAGPLLTSLFGYFSAHPDKLPENCLRHMEDGVSRAVCDHIAGMSDRYAVAMYLDIFVPKGWNKA